MARKLKRIRIKKMAPEFLNRIEHRARVLAFDNYLRASVAVTGVEAWGRAGIRAQRWIERAQAAAAAKED